MPRYVVPLTLLVACLPLPVFAADYMRGDFRPGYETWDVGDDNIDIELGTRYWYSLGGQQMSVLGDNYSASDTSHIGEAFLRIDDNESAFFGKGTIGYSSVINNSYTTPTVPAGTSNSGKIFYFGGDIGYMPLGNDDVRLGGIVGYQYLTDSPDMGRESFMVSSGGGDSQVNDLTYQLVKLGLTGRIKLGDVADITAEAAIIPYAQLNGTYGAFVAPAIALESQGSSGHLSGWMYGASGEVMARFHPTRNWTVGVGARAWYLTGQADVEFTTRTTLSPATETGYVTQTNAFSQFRYGLLGEVSYRF